MTAPSIREAVARAINKLHPPTCDGPGGCSCAYECERWDSGWVNHLEDADAALAVALPIIREHYAGVAEKKAEAFLSPEYATGQPLSSLQERFACKQVAAAIRADEGPK